MKFVMTGMSVDATIHDTPGGRRYQISNGIPFEVHPDDEEYFTKRGFTHVTMDNIVAVEAQVEQEKEEKAIRKHKAKPSR